jgi:hypothetical protein
MKQCPSQCSTLKKPHLADRNSGLKSGLFTTLFSLTCAALAPSSALAVEPGSFPRSVEAPVLQARQLDEASGLATSSRDGNLIWAINDSGAPPELFLIDAAGADRGSLRITAARNVDWEDLAAFEIQGKPYLLIADVGDNNSARNHCILYIIQEPRLPAAGARINGSVPIHHSIRFRYEDGPRDCEAVAVDAAEGKIILLSKRTKPPMIYELPLRLSGRDEILTARKIGETQVMPPPAARFLPYSDQPTGLDFSRDRTMAAVLTYFGVFVFPRQRNESWVAAFARQPVMLAPHLLPQAEAIAFSPDGMTIHVASEGAGTPLIRYGK